MGTHSSADALDVNAIRGEFPILGRKVGGRPVIYLDSAATSLKPRAVIAAIVEFYERYTANIHRGVHLLSEEASERFDEARETVARFINAEFREVAFVRNTSEAINLVAANLPADASVLYGLDAHHSNQLPWRRFTRRHAVRIAANGGIDLEDLRRKLRDARPALLAVTHVSNAFGAVNPVQEIVAMAHEAGARVLVDASQSVPHQAVDVRTLDCDFLCFSGHKMCGPSGIGVLYGKHEALRLFAPLHLGGGIVESVHEDSYELRDVPWRLEAGTPHIEGAVGLAAACDFLESIGLEAIHRHESALVRRATALLQEIPGVRLYGPTDGSRSGAVTFTVEGLEAHGVSRMLSNRHNIYVRSGFHCAQPAHEILNAPPTVRASFYLYNEAREIEQLAQALGDFVAGVAADP